ncbi:MAG: hypothetical protein ACTHOG_12565 [Marmoricola sp.]
MAAPVIESILVRRPLEVVAPVATDPHSVLPLVGGWGRFEMIEERPDGTEEWDLFLDVGTLHVGGRVLVEHSGTTLSWRALRGTRHTAELLVTAVDDATTQITATMTVEFDGMVAAAITSRLARGIVSRHLQAGLQELRHYLEFER